MLTNIKKISRFKLKLLAVSYTLWLTAVSLAPLEGIEMPSFSYADKIVHFFLYFFLTVFWLLAVPRLWHRKITFVILVINWGIIIEFIQEYLIPSRSGDVFDALANSIGGIAGILIYHYLLNKQLARCFQE